MNPSTDNARNGLAPTGRSLIAQRPNQVLPDLYATNKGQSCPLAPCVSYLTNAVLTAPLGTYGNMGISTARAPGFWEWDQAITRQFPIREAMWIEFRAEGFHLTNSVRLGAPIATLSGTYGQITTDQPTTGAGRGVSPGTGGRILQFALKFLF